MAVRPTNISIHKASHTNRKLKVLTRACVEYKGRIKLKDALLLANVGLVGHTLIISSWVAPFSV